jgi:hypothetical protein
MSKGCAIHLNHCPVERRLSPGGRGCPKMNSDQPARTGGSGERKVPRWPLSLGREVVFGHSIRTVQLLLRTVHGQCPVPEVGRRTEGDEAPALQGARRVHIPVDIQPTSNPPAGGHRLPSAEVLPGQGTQDQVCPVRVGIADPRDGGPSERHRQLLSPAGTLAGDKGGRQAARVNRPPEVGLGLVCSLVPGVWDSATGRQWLGSSRGIPRVGSWVMGSAAC